jgi:serine/threonine-protein kinase
MDSHLPHYTREKLLGEGGMGKVYLAKDNQLQRQVAIKELTYQSKDAKINFALKEARLLARVNHSNIIQIYNIHDENNQISLVMEYFHSKTLTQFQSETHLTLIDKLDLLRQLSAGLAQAHKSSVIHCDLKPSNILVNTEGQLKVADFGIACFATNDARLDEPQQSQAAFGSLFFMSPEQIKQQAVDYRSDIFSLGIIAYQLIVGSHPFGNSASKVAENICENAPEHAANLMIDAPKALTDLLMAMLIKPVEQRTLTALEIEHRIKHIQNSLLQRQIDEEHTLPISAIETAKGKSSQANSELKQSPDKKIKYALSSCILVFAAFLVTWFYQPQEVDTKQVVVLRPTIINSPLMAPMQKNLVISAVEDALRQSVINTKDMYLVSQREVNSITKNYPNDLKKLKLAVGATDIISSELECDNSRCKVNFSRLVSNPDNSGALSVKFEKNWLVPIESFNVIHSASQTQFATLYSEHLEVNKAGLVQRPINEDDYRNYIELYSQIKLRGDYNESNLTELKVILTNSPYLYAAYSLYRDTALNLYWDSKNKKYLNQLDDLLKSSPPEYRYSVYETIDRFWLAADMGKVELAKYQINEAEKRGADTLTLLEFEAYIYFNTEQYQKSALTYFNAFKLRPSSNLLYNSAFSYWRMGNLTKAESILSQVLEITPKNYKAKRLQANIWLLQGRLNIAISAYENIVSSLHNGKDLTNLSLAYGLNKQYSKSLELAQKALIQNPKHPFKLLNLADIEMILGHEKLAKAHYQQVIQTLVGKKEVKYLTNLAQAYGQLERADLAIGMLNEAQAIAPNKGEVSYASALVYSLLKEKSSAIHHTKAALKNNIGSVWFNLPWFDALCVDSRFQQLMVKYNNASRCFN